MREKKVCQLENRQDIIRPPLSIRILVPLELGEQIQELACVCCCSEIRLIQASSRLN